MSNRGKGKSPIKGNVGGVADSGVVKRVLRPRIPKPVAETKPKIKGFKKANNGKKRARTEKRPEPPLGLVTDGMKFDTVVVVPEVEPVMAQVCQFPNLRACSETRRTNIQNDRWGTYPTVIKQSSVPPPPTVYPFQRKEEETETEKPTHSKLDKNSRLFTTQFIVSTPSSVNIYLWQSLEESSHNMILSAFNSVSESKTNKQLSKFWHAFRVCCQAAGLELIRLRRTAGKPLSVEDIKTLVAKEMQKYSASSFISNPNATAMDYGFKALLEHSNLLPTDLIRAIYFSQLKVLYEPSNRFGGNPNETALHSFQKFNTNINVVKLTTLHEPNSPFIQYKNNPEEFPFSPMFLTESSPRKLVS